MVTLPLLFSKEFSAVTAALQLNSEATGIGAYKMRRENSDSF